MADRSGRFWEWTIAGYAITVVSVPLLGLASALWVACGLVILERVGKAVRAPSKDTLLSHATSATGRGKGFAVHEAIDQFGALLGPLIVAAVLYLTGDDYTPALLILAIPGLGLMLLVLALRRRVPNPAVYEEHPEHSPTPGIEPRGGGTAPPGLLGVRRLHRSDHGRVRHLRGPVLPPRHGRPPGGGRGAAGLRGAPSWWMRWRPC